MPGQKAEINVEDFRTVRQQETLVPEHWGRIREIVRVSLIIIGHDSCGS
jgi:hypothetical protein